MSYKIIGASLVALAAGSANAAFISFASDSDPDNPTLVASFSEVDRGLGGTTLIAEFDPTFVDLEVDPDGDGPLGETILNAQLGVSMVLDYVNSVEIVPGMFTHIFSLVGNFAFTGFDDARGNPSDWRIEGTIDAGEAVFTGLGSDEIVSSASMTGFDISYELIDVPFLGSGENLWGDFGFTLTDINDGAGAQLVFDDAPLNQGLANVIGINDFTSEASFSGSFVPTPGTVAIAGISGICFARRRRIA